MLGVLLMFHAFISAIRLVLEVEYFKRFYLYITFIDHINKYNITRNFSISDLNVSLLKNNSLDICVFSRYSHLEGVQEFLPTAFATQSEKQKLS